MRSISGNGHILLFCKHVLPSNDPTWCSQFLGSVDVTKVKAFFEQATGRLRSWHILSPSNTVLGRSSCHAVGALRTRTASQEPLRSARRRCESSPRRLHPAMHGPLSSLSPATSLGAKDSCYVGKITGSCWIVYHSHFHLWEPSILAEIYIGSNTCFSKGIPAFVHKYWTATESDLVLGA